VPARGGDAGIASPGRHCRDADAFEVFPHDEENVAVVVDDEHFLGTHRRLLFRPTPVSVRVFYAPMVLRQERGHNTFFLRKESIVSPFYLSPFYLSPFYLTVQSG